MCLPSLETRVEMDGCRSGWLAVFQPFVDHSPQFTIDTVLFVAQL